MTPKLELAIGIDSITKNIMNSVDTMDTTIHNNVVDGPVSSNLLIQNSIDQTESCSQDVNIDKVESKQGLDVNVSNNLSIETFRESDYVMVYGFGKNDIGRFSLIGSLHQPTGEIMSTLIKITGR